MCHYIWISDQPSVLVLMSLLETAKRNGLEPHAWLTDVLMRLPEWPEERLAELLPLEGFTFSG